jgi:hypothetical protein
MYCIYRHIEAAFRQNNAGSSYSLALIFHFFENGTIAQLSISQNKTRQDKTKQEDNTITPQGRTTQDTKTGRDGNFAFLAEGTNQKAFREEAVLPRRV